MKSNLRIGIWLLLIILCGDVLGQSDTTKTKGEIITGEIVIEKEKKIVLPKAEKVFLRSETGVIQTDPLKQTFTIREPEMQWPAYTATIPFKLVPLQKPDVRYQNYTRLGFGNDRSWLVETGLFKKLGEWNTNLLLDYERFGTGPVLSENSGNSEGGLILAAYRQIGSVQVKPFVSYQGRGFNYYGNTDRVNTPFPTNAAAGSWGAFELGGAAEGTNEKFNFRIKSSFSNVNHEIGVTEENSESVFSTIGDMSYSLSKGLSADVAFNFNAGQYKGGVEYGRSVLNIQPTITKTSESLDFSLGVNLATNTIDGNTNLGIYPTARASLAVSDYWKVNGFLEGGQQMNLLSDLLLANSFLDDSLALSNQETEYKFGGGIIGSPTEKISMKLMVCYESLNALPFFLPSGTDSTRFTLGYDQGPIAITRFNGGITYTPNLNNLIGADLQLNAFSLNSFVEAWHMPSWVMKAYSNHTIKEKIIINTYFTALGGLRSPANTDTGQTKLDSFLDLGFGTTYLISKRASAFIEVNNLLNNEYERYLGYPIRGIAFKIGAQYRF